MTAIEPIKAGEIQHASSEEIAVMTNSVLDADKALSQCNTELDMLNDAMKQLSYTKDEYDKKSAEARKRMQRLVTRI